MPGARPASAATARLHNRPETPTREVESPHSLARRACKPAASSCSGSVGVKLPSKFGSKRRMRPSSGGCVAKRLKIDPAKASPKNMWLISWAWASRMREPSASPPIFFSAGQPGRVAGELHAGGVGQELPLPRDGGLDDVAQQHAQVAQDVDCQADQEHGRAVVVAAAFRIARGARPAGRPHHVISDDREREDAEDDANEAEVQPHVAVEHVAELVAQHALHSLRVRYSRQPRETANTAWLGW